MGQEKNLYLPVIWFNIFFLPPLYGFRALLNCGDQQFISLVTIPVVVV